MLRWFKTWLLARLIKLIMVHLIHLERLISAVVCKSCSILKRPTSPAIKSKWNCKIHPRSHSTRMGRRLATFNKFLSSQTVTVSRDKIILSGAEHLPPRSSEDTWGRKRAAVSPSLTSGYINKCIIHVCRKSKQRGLYIDLLMNSQWAPPPHKSGRVSEPTPFAWLRTYV